MASFACVSRPNSQRPGCGALLAAVGLCANGAQPRTTIFHNSTALAFWATHEV